MPMPNRPLLDRGIVVTRPAHQASGLTTAIEDAGGSVYPFPTLEIVPPRNPQPALERFATLERYQIILFISANAARIGMEMIQQVGKLPPDLAVAAVGKATTHTLKRSGVTVDILPQHRFDSEGLLQTAPLQSVAGKRILIVRGEGGRELLATTLRQRGAEVDYAEAYRRIVPQSDPTPLLQAWEKGAIDAVVVTSNQSLDNLITLVGSVGRQFLLNTTLVVISQRTAEVARERGFLHPPLLAENPDDRAIITTLCDYFAASATPAISNESE